MRQLAGKYALLASAPAAALVPAAQVVPVVPVARVTSTSAPEAGAVG